MPRGRQEIYKNAYHVETSTFGTKSVTFRIIEAILKVHSSGIMAEESTQA